MFELSPRMFSVTFARENFLTAYLRHTSDFHLLEEGDVLKFPLFCLVDRAWGADDDELQS